VEAFYQGTNFSQDEDKVGGSCFSSMEERWRKKRTGRPKKACPTTQEEKLLKEMWTVATLDERKTIATLILKNGPVIPFDGNRGSFRNCRIKASGERE